MNVTKSFMFCFQGSLDDTLPYPFAGEIRGMSKYSGLNLGESFMCLNLALKFDAGSLESGS